MMDMRRVLGFVTAALGLWLWIGAGSGLVGIILTVLGLAVAFAPHGGYAAAFGRGSMTMVAVGLFVAAAIAMIVGGPVGLVMGIVMVAAGVWLIKTRRLLA